MKGISINLLPTEATNQQKEVSKAKKVKIFSIVFLLLMFFLASVLITLRILQTQTISKLQVQAKSSEATVSSFRDKESTLVLLKNRLELIEGIKSAPSKQKTVYDTLSKKLPPSISLSAVTLDSGGNLSISTTTANSDELTRMLSDLASEESFSSIANISVDSLSRGRDGSYRVSLKLTSK